MPSSRSTNRLRDLKKSTSTRFGEHREHLEKFTDGRRYSGDLLSTEHVNRASASSECRHRLDRRRVDLVELLGAASAQAQFEARATVVMSGSLDR